MRKFYTDRGTNDQGDHLIDSFALEKLYVCLTNGDINNITLVDIIVEERLKAFGKMLSSFGYNLHLITLPEFHVTAFHMFNLSKKFSCQGINAFVKSVQRPERLLSEKDKSYTYYKHQTATGTGIEAEFAKAVGSSNTNMLSHSTEADDSDKRRLE